MVLTEDEFRRPHLRTWKWKTVCIKPDPFLTTIQYIILTKSQLLMYQGLAMVIYHILCLHGSKPRNESEARMAGGKNTLPTLLLFQVVHTKINQQLWKVSSFQSFGTDCWSNNHPSSVSPCVLYGLSRGYITEHNFSLWDKSCFVIVCRKVLGDRSGRKDDKMTGCALLCWPQIMLCQYTSTITWSQA